MHSVTVVQVLDYYPYGSPRIKTGTDTAQREYIGQMFDESSQLSYLNARYYDGSRGQFLSQDPVFWEVGQTKDGKNVLTNPQALNSYAYANGNPITNKDPNGRTSAAALYATLRIAAAALAIAAYYMPASSQGSISSAITALGQMAQSVSGTSGSNFNPMQMIQANPYPVGVRSSPTIVNTPYTKTNTPWGSINISEGEAQRKGLAPEGILPPVEDPDALKIGPASRPSQAAKGGESYWEPSGAEWRYAPEDKYHNPHWDFNPHDKPNAPWQNIPHGNLPPLKGS